MTFLGDESPQHQVQIGHTVDMYRWDAKSGLSGGHNEFLPRSTLHHVDETRRHRQLRAQPSQRALHR
ncbi:hypothetical protein N7449_010358 [Penicillium cf. viridicatum]|uniref:Uncharacterized protein n=1 Tax=Penicillium cf. viridicatum TaxID=2972119 RepID=A0A9W9IYE2_9EURO|nr:hypothetical protein N7449_010358 [Penicillium cf. viridicatum]